MPLINFNELVGSGYSPAPDIRLVQNANYPAYSVNIDWNLLGDGTLDETQALATAVILALGTNALADTNDELPDPDSSDRSGWWGDLEADTIWNAWPIGAKLWLLRRSAIESVASRRGSTVARVIAYINLALQPFINNQIASTFTVAAERVDRQRIDARIVIYRARIPAVSLLYSVLWDEQQQATSFPQQRVMLPAPPLPPPVVEGYVAEDGMTGYVAEDGSSPYVPS